MIISSDQAEESLRRKKNVEKVKLKYAKTKYRK